MSNLPPEIRAAPGGDVEAVRRHLVSLRPHELTAELTRRLHVAVEWDQLAIAKFLIDAGAPVEGRNHLGETPLMHAVGYCTICIEMVELLIAAGADADAENNGERVIDYANSADTTRAMQTAALEALWRAPRRNRDDSLAI